MRKLLHILMLSVLFVSCSSDENRIIDDGDNGMIDEKIIGKWKVEYSKTIKPAIYNETSGKPEYNENESVITEYKGNFGEPNTIPECGLFDVNEYNIEINANNYIFVTRVNNKPIKSINYIIEGNYLKWQVGDNNPTAVVKYKLKDNRLIMELIKAEGMKLNYYTISEYSRIN